jgi:hypothetical protein
MAIPARVIRELPKLTWRGLFAPCEAAPVDGAHAQVERKAYGVDAAWHDHAGREPYTMNVKLHFINTMFDGIIWFPNKWNEWRKALEDGSPGKLRHPLLGEMDAVVNKWNQSLDSKQTAGISVDVTFTETLLDVTKANALKAPAVDVKALTKQVLVDAGNLGINFPSGRLDGSLFDAIDSFFGNITSAEMTITGLGNQIVGGIEDMISRVEMVADPSAAPAYDNLVFLWSALTDKIRDAEKVAARSTATVLLGSDTTFDAVSTERGNSVEELMGLNPGLVRFRVIPKGSALVFYTGK